MAKREHPIQHRYLTHDGRRLLLSEWAAEMSVNRWIVLVRWQRGVRAFGELFAPERPRLRFIEHEGRRQTIAAWARELGISRERLRQRLLKYPVAIALRLA